MNKRFIKRDKMLAFRQPVIGDEKIAAVTEDMKTGWLGTGPLTKRFQDLFLETFAAKNALAMNACTDSLHLSIIASALVRKFE